MPLILAGGWPAAWGNGASFTETDRLLVDVQKNLREPALSCAELLRVNDVEARITSVRWIAESRELPDQCQVFGIIDPEIEFIARFPAKWNGRLYVRGNGGDAGESVRGNMAMRERNAALRLGFITTFSNGGHDAAAWPGSRWAYDSEQREIDYSYRALHLNTVVVKELAARYYSEAPTHSYFDGCSTGGGQGFKAAQRFPEDFDGILAGAPVFDPPTLLLHIWHNQRAQQVMQFDAQRVQLLGEIIMRKYDGVDGVVDGVIGNPAAIDFEPRRDLPQDSGGENGFTDSEIDGLAMLYGGLFHNGQQLAPGIPIGAELAGQSYAGDDFAPAEDASAWVDRIIPGANGGIVMRDVMQDWFRYLLLDRDDPALDWRDIDLDDVLPRMELKRPMLSAVDPDLQSFRDRGGKLLIYTGWGDIGVNPYLVVDYYERLRERYGAETGEFARLYMIPGMFHCRGGLNVDRFDGMTALINWVEQGKAPDVIPAKRIDDGGTVRTRPLCPYPAVASYLGAGDVDRAESFECR